MNPMMRTVSIGVVLAVTPLAELAGQERQIRLDVVVPARIDVVWSLWTTADGVQSFFAPGSNIDLRVDGLYEIFFDPDAPKGLRGADGMRLLAVEPRRRLAFTWNAPAQMPDVRAQRTVVIVDLDPVGTDSTRVTLRHVGWGTGPQWDAAITYFDSAWKNYVLPFLKHRIEHGPIDWRSPPRLDPVARTGIQHLIAANR